MLFTIIQRLKNGHARFKGNANTIEEISKTIIHEETHLEYDVFGAQWAAAFCDLRAELHAKGELFIK